MQSHACSGCMWRIEWGLACVSQKGGRRCGEARREERALASAEVGVSTLGELPFRVGFNEKRVELPSRFTAAPL